MSAAQTKDHMAGEILGRQRRCWSVVGEDDVGGGPCLELAERDVQRFRCPPGGGGSCVGWPSRSRQRRRRRRQGGLGCFNLGTRIWDIHHFLIGTAFPGSFKRGFSNLTPDCDQQIRVPPRSEEYGPSAGLVESAGSSSYNGGLRSDKWQIPMTTNHI